MENFQQVSSLFLPQAMELKCLETYKVDDLIMTMQNFEFPVKPFLQEYIMHLNIYSDRGKYYNYVFKWHTKFVYWAYTIYREQFPRNHFNIKDKSAYNNGKNENSIL